MFILNSSLLSVISNYYSEVRSSLVISWSDRQAGAPASRMAPTWGQIIHIDSTHVALLLDVYWIFRFQQNCWNDDVKCMGSINYSYGLFTFQFCCNKAFRTPKITIIKPNSVERSILCAIYKTMVCTCACITHPLSCKDRGPQLVELRSLFISTTSHTRPTACTHWAHAQREAESENCTSC